MRLAITFFVMVALNALAQDGQFVRTGGMVTGRSGFSATLLKDGRVLIAGGTVPNGNSSAPLSSAEIYDPATGRFRATGKMATARPGPQAVALQDGRVLIMEYGPPEIFDPATERFTPVGLDYGRDSSPTGGDYFAVGSSIRRYDPTTNLLSYIGNADAYGDAVVLPNQRVVSAGPENISIYEVRDGALFLVKRHPTGSEWYYRSATRLADGTVLISGGSKGYDLPTSDEALVFDPRKDSSKSTGMMLFPQEGHATTVLADGRVLISGGYSQGGYDSGDFPGAELYDASTGQFTSAGG